MQAIPRIEADLHCHTTASDGLLRPEEVVMLAARSGLKALAITDHDTIAGWEKAREAAEQVGIILVKGIEINTDGNGQEIHILGYGMDEKNPCFLKKLLDLQERRIERIKAILEKLAKIQVNISLEEVMEFARGESVGRPHIAQTLEKYGYARSVKEAFEKYLKAGAPAYVPRNKVSPALAIEIIHQAGGSAVLAHPGHNLTEKIIAYWAEQGLDGIEVSHPDHSPEETVKYRLLAEKLKLVATGGSDFHGPGAGRNVKLGDWGVGLEVIDQLLNNRSNIKK